MSDIWVMGRVNLLKASKCIAENVDFESLKKAGIFAFRKCYMYLGMYELFLGCKNALTFMHFDIILV